MMNVEWLNFQQKFNNICPWFCIIFEMLLSYFSCVNIQIYQFILVEQVCNNNYFEKHISRLLFITQSWLQFPFTEPTLIKFGGQ